MGTPSIHAAINSIGFIGFTVSVKARVLVQARKQKENMKNSRLSGRKKNTYDD